MKANYAEMSTEKCMAFVHAVRMALPPVIVLPVSYFVYKEKIGWQALAGTFLAIAGVAILFLV